MSINECPDRSKAPETQPFGELSLPEANIIYHSSGAKIHVFDGAEGSVCRLTMIWPGGEADSSFCGRMSLALQAIKDGNATMSPSAVADCLDYNGARLVLSAGKHTSMLRLICANSRIGRVLPVVLDCVLRPAMPQKSIDILLENAAMSVALAERQVMSRAMKAAARLIYGVSHPAAREATPELIRSLTRDDLILSQQTVCNTVNGLDIYVAGKVTPEVLATLDESISRFASQASGHGIAPEYSPMCPEAPGVATEHIAGALQSCIVMAFPSITRDNPDYQALRTTVMALGGYFGSRLMSNIREDKGLTYGIQAALLGEREGAYISISSQQDTSNTDIVINETISEIEKLRTGLLDNTELERLRNHAMSEIATVLDTPFSIADYRMCEVTEGMPDDYYHRLQQQVRTITAEKIRDMARKYIDPAMARTAIATCP